MSIAQTVSYWFSLLISYLKQRLWKGYLIINWILGIKSWKYSWGVESLTTMWEAVGFSTEKKYSWHIGDGWFKWIRTFQNTQNILWHFIFLLFLVFSVISTSFHPQHIYLLNNVYLRLWFRISLHSSHTDQMRAQASSQYILGEKEGNMKN